MSSVNKQILLGNVTRDPEVRALPSGTKCCTFGVATNTSFTDSTGVKKEKVEFHNIEAFAGLAEVCSKYVKKGMKVYVDGRTEHQTWGDEGAQKSKTIIKADNVVFLGSASTTTQNEKKQDFGNEPSFNF